MTNRIDLRTTVPDPGLPEAAAPEAQVSCLSFRFLLAYLRSQGIAPVDFIADVFRRLFSSAEDDLSRRYFEFHEYPVAELRSVAEQVRTLAIRGRGASGRGWGRAVGDRQYAHVAEWLARPRNWIPDSLSKLLFLEAKHALGGPEALLAAARYIADGRSLVRRPIEHLQTSVYAVCGGPDFLEAHADLFNAFFNRTKTVQIVKGTDLAYVLLRYDRKDARLRSIRTNRDIDAWNAGCYEAFLRIDGRLLAPVSTLMSAADIGDLLTANGMDFTQAEDGSYLVGGERVTRRVERTEAEEGIELVQAGQLVTSQILSSEGTVLFQPSDNILYDERHSVTVYKVLYSQRKRFRDRLRGVVAYPLLTRGMALRRALEIGRADRSALQHELAVESAKVAALTAEERQQRELAEAALARAEAAQQAAAEAHSREMAESQRLSAAEAQITTGKAYAASAAHDINNALGPARSGIEEILRVLREARPAREEHQSEAEAAEADFARQLGKVIEAELAGIAEAFERATGNLSRSEAELLLDRLEFLARVSRTMREAIPDIYRGINRASDYTSFMSEMARVDYAQEREAVRLDELLGELAAKYRRLWERQGIELEQELSGEATVLGWRHVLESVFSNLLDNAAKALQESEEKRVRVVLSREGERCVVAVEDTGPGIAKELREKVFELGYTTHPADGKGFGLAYVKNYVTLLGGSVSIDNRETGGACAVVRLPGTMAEQHDRRNARSGD